MYKHAYDSVHWYVNEVTSHVVAKTGFPSDRYHLGRMILHSLKDNQDLVGQIDGATGESETNASILDRSVRCAVALTNLGLKTDDVIALMGPNHIHLCIPQYAALYLGINIAPVDAASGVPELRHMFNILKPKVIVCQSDRSDDVKEALNQLEITSEVITFDESDSAMSLAQLIRNVDDLAVEAFQPTDFDPTSTVAYSSLTSGTTGLPKAAMITHKNLMTSVPYIWTGFSKFPSPTRMVIVVSHLQWLTAVFHYIFSPILVYIRLQTSATVTADHFAELINKYKPTFTTVSPTLITALTTSADKCDLTCFEGMLLGGSAVSSELISELKRLTRSDRVYGVYGLSEVSGIAFFHEYPPLSGSSGRLIGALNCRLVDHEKNADILEANIPGELWLQGPVIFKGYFNDPEMTANAFTEDGWLKTGDIFYRDESWNFFFVERLKLLLKYRNHQISPEELEAVIKSHPGVLDVAVVGIPDKDVGDLVVACVVPRPGKKPTAQQLKDLVKEKLTESKQLRGGVIFVSELPLTSSSKIHRRKLKEMVLTMERE